jgi:hypothetical protein
MSIGKELQLGQRILIKNLIHEKSQFYQVRGVEETELTW